MTINPSVHTDFELRICDIFRLSDQRTVIVGTIEDHPNPIGATGCRIVVDGVEKGTITISGEELLENAQRNRDKRALSTNDPVPLDTDTIGTADCRLIAIGGRQRLHSSFRPKTVLAVGIFDAVVGSLLCVGSILLFQRVRDLEFWSGSVRLNAPVLRVVGAAFLAVGLLYLWRGVYHLIVAARSAP